MAGYTIILAIGAGVYSKLTGRFSFKFSYTIGLILFTVGSIVGFFSTTFTQVIIGRLVDLNMSYRMVYIGLAAIGLLSFLLTFSVRETNDKVDEWQIW